MKTAVIFALPAILLLSACAGQQTCRDDMAYRQAAAVPPIKPAEGLNLPESASALKVPSLTPAAQAAAKQPLPKKGKGTACLDYPPEIEVETPAEEPAKG